MAAVRYPAGLRRSAAAGLAGRRTIREVRQLAILSATMYTKRDSGASKGP
jgi:hypothetical protein